MFFLNLLILSNDTNILPVLIFQFNVHIYLETYTKQLFELVSNLIFVDRVHTSHFVNLN